MTTETTEDGIFQVEEVSPGVTIRTLIQPSQSYLDRVAADAALVQANMYKVLRERAYPSVGDQLDALWKGGSDFETMKKKIDAIKAQYPKPA